MDRYIAMHKYSELNDIRDQFQVEFGIDLNKYREIEDFDEVWKKLLHDVGNVDIFMELNKIVYDIKSGKLNFNTDEWKKTVDIFSSEVCNFVWEDDIFMNAYFTWRFLKAKEEDSNRKEKIGQRKIEGVSENFLKIHSHERYFFPIQEEYVHSSFCKAFKEYVFEKKRCSIFKLDDVIEYLGFKQESVQLDQCSERKAIDATRWGKRKMIEMEGQMNFTTEDRIFFHKIFNPVLVERLRNLWKNNYWSINSDICKTLQIFHICGIESFGIQSIILKIIEEQENLISRVADNMYNPKIIRAQREKELKGEFDALIEVKNALEDLIESIFNNVNRINERYKLLTGGIIYCCCQSTAGRGEAFLEKKAELVLKNLRTMFVENTNKGKKREIWRQGEVQDLYSHIQAEVLLFSMVHYHPRLDSSK